MTKKNKHKVYHYNSFFAAIGFTYGTYKIHSLSHEGTDDAQIEKKHEPHHS
jgi:membrane fusion protein (multidrug efflux system)